MSLCYKSGHGVHKDRITAYKWFETAAAGGHEAARKARNSMF
ncbi:hypothetical protein EON65_41400 [archaeon]|nr:MAG: hypothetical protein EON65_41400 [archaeon]